jgi:glycerol-3-phosphate dehydrogenase (NAD(P)+)
MEDHVAVIGAGSWGTAMASLLAANAPTTLWARSGELAASISATHENERYLPGIALCGSLKATADLHEALTGATTIFWAVPSHGTRAVLDHARTAIADDALMVSLCKGVETATLLTMTQVMNELVPQAQVAVVTGPNLAGEIARGTPAACVVACADAERAVGVQGLVHAPTFRAYTSSDIVGCEVAGATKNVIALAAGIVDGMGMGENARAALIARGLAEMTRLGVAMGGQTATMSGLAGVGDLIVTCTSDKSRNRTVGVALGEGVELAAIIESMQMVAEGVKSAGPLCERARQLGVELPICEQVAAIVAGSTTPSAALATLMDRPRGAE